MENFGNITNIENCLQCSLPTELKLKYQDKKQFISLNIRQIQDIVAFAPPFLRTTNLVIFGRDVVDSLSIGVGTVFPEDMEGHYNKTIYLAFAGRLMPSTATIHIAHFFPNTSPQAIEGVSIRMDKDAFNNGLIQPKNSGTKFFVETRILKKKLNLVMVETRVMFGQAKFGLIENLRFILTEKDSINKAVCAPDVS